VGDATRAKHRKKGVTALRETKQNTTVQSLDTAPQRYHLPFYLRFLGMNMLDSAGFFLVMIRGPCNKLAKCLA